MERVEYMRIKGELTVASEQLSVTRQEKRKTQEAIQGWTNRLLSNKLTPEYSAEGHDLIDRMLGLQQLEATHEAQESQYKRALHGVPMPQA